VFTEPGTIHYGWEFGKCPWTKKREMERKNNYYYYYYYCYYYY
jgi:hypothetical protein